MTYATDIDTGLDELDVTTHYARDAQNFRKIVAANKQVEEAERRLRQAVDDARQAGDSWTIIGAALGITRQGAQKRFG
ncbi:MAG: hypothetical protein E6448_07375 [Actinomyces sp.]|nr:hypothetical protein [Actinomyces sp.]